MSTMEYQENNQDEATEEEFAPQDTEPVAVEMNGAEGIEYMSREGYKKLKQELETLKTKERIHIAERLEYAKSLGDLSENAEFDAAKEEQMLTKCVSANLNNFCAAPLLWTSMFLPRPWALVPPLWCA